MSLGNRLHDDTLKGKNSNTQLAETGRSLGAAEAGLESRIFFFLRSGGQPCLA